MGGNLQSVGSGNFETEKRQELKSDPGVFTTSNDGSDRVAQPTGSEGELDNTNLKPDNVDQASEYLNATKPAPDVPENVDPTGGTLQSCIVHAPDILRPLKEGDDRQTACLNRATGMSDRLGIHYQIIPPGYRTACPHAHSAEDELVFCLQGRGTIWQNGWIYPFAPGDVAGWKAGTGVTHCIINDTKHVPGQPNDEEEEDLILLVVGEHKPEEDKLYYPLNPENYDVIACRWEDYTQQNAGGAHPGVARAERPNDTLLGYQVGARPSNILNWQDQLAPAGKGELFAYATSLSQETGLSGRFGCNLEIMPPGARSSDPHAHSVEDELVFVIQGEGLVWLDGHTFPVSAGDAVGFRGGTGLAHTIINNSNSQDGESGQDLVLWIVGENRRSEDRVVYPIHPEKSKTFARWWTDAPKRMLGDHNGRATNPRI